MLVWSRSVQTVNGLVDLVSIVSEIKFELLSADSTHGIELEASK